MLITVCQVELVIKLVARIFLGVVSVGMHICSYADLAGWLSSIRHIDRSGFLQSEVSKMVKGMHFTHDPTIHN